MKPREPVKSLQVIVDRVEPDDPTRHRKLVQLLAEMVVARRRQSPVL
jgi:hypothetical protein